jgi:hypothetical protein
MCDLVYSIVFLNGVYDVFCAFCILSHSKSIFSKLHVNLFKEKYTRENPVLGRILAYWIFLYGLIRLMAGLDDDIGVQCLGVMSYCSEAFFIEYELNIGETLSTWQAHFVAILSFFLAFLMAMNVYNPSCIEHEM